MSGKVLGRKVLQPQNDTSAVITILNRIANSLNPTPAKQNLPEWNIENDRMESRRLEPMSCKSLSPKLLFFKMHPWHALQKLQRTLIIENIYLGKCRGQYLLA